MKDEKSCKVMNAVLIVCFSLVIGAPVLSINRVEGQISTIENKRLTVKPDLFLADGTISSDFAAEFKRWFDDNIGFRDCAMAVNLISKYKIFHVLDLNDWILGENGEKFYTAGGEEIKTYTGENVFTQEDMQQMTKNLVCMNRYFEEMGCDTYNMFIPNKEGVYSDWYSPYIYHEEKSKQEKFCEYLTENSNLKVINMKEPLIEAAKEQRVFYKAWDASHWNMNGAFVGYQKLMQEIEKTHPDITALSLEDFEVSEEQWYGLNNYYDSSSAIKNCFRFDDILYHYNLKKGWDYKVEQNPPEGMEINANLNYYHYSNEVIDNQHCMLIVGDSYVYSFMMPFFAESFHDVYFIRNTDAATIVKLAETANPDIFVYEVAERVGTKNYYDCMAEYQEYLENRIDWNSAVYNGEDTRIYIDFPLVEGGTLKIDGTDMTILGWGVDSLYDKQPKAIVCNVNGHYIEADFYYRQDLDEWDTKYANCGFQIKLPGNLMENAQKLTFYVVAQDGSVYNGYEVTIR